MNQTNNSACGGTLIDLTTVLSAAHCFDGTNNLNTSASIESMYKVYLGLYDKSKIDSLADIYPAMAYDVDRIIVVCFLIYFY